MRTTWSKIELRAPRYQRRCHNTNCWWFQGPCISKFHSASLLQLPRSIWRSQNPRFYTSINFLPSSEARFRIWYPCVWNFSSGCTSKLSSLQQSPSLHASAGTPYPAILIGKLGGCPASSITSKLWWNRLLDRWTGTCELVLVSYDIGVVQFLHDVYLLVYVFLEEGLLLDVHFADDLHGV